MAFHEDRIAVPAEIAIVDLEHTFGVLARLVEPPLVTNSEMDRLVETIIVDQLVRDGSAAAAHPLVGFLQCDNIRVDLMEDVHNPMRVALAIETDGLAHVVGSNGDGAAAGHASANIGHGRSVPKRRDWRR